MEAFLDTLKQMNQSSTTTPTVYLICTSAPPEMDGGGGGDSQPASNTVVYTLPSEFPPPPGALHRKPKQIQQKYKEHHGKRYHHQPHHHHNAENTSNSDVYCCERSHHHHHDRDGHMECCENRHHHHHHKGGDEGDEACAKNKQHASWRDGGRPRNADVYEKKVQGNSKRNSRDGSPQVGKEEREDVKEKAVAMRRDKRKTMGIGARTNSRELRGGKLFIGCDCEKRNGLQDECQRSLCQGSPECTTIPPTCIPSEFSNGKHLTRRRDEAEKRYRERRLNKPKKFSQP